MAAYVLPPPPDAKDPLIQGWLFELYKRNASLVDSATSIGGLVDVTITSAALNELLAFNGTVWVNTPPIWAADANDNLFSVSQEAGGSITTASENVLIGATAGAAVTTADGNVAIGFGAMADDASVAGIYNIVIGYNAMGGTGLDANNQNIAIGLDCAAAITTGDENIFLGTGTGIALTTGGANIFIGDGAGVKVTTGSNNVVLGLNAGPTSNQSDKLFIHNAETDTPLISGDFSTPGVIINGTFNPTGVTTVGGDILSDTDSTDSLGSTGVRWAALWVDAITVTGVITSSGSIDVTGDMLMAEQSAADDPGAAKGRWWIKDDAPNVPMFTDDGDTDHQLSYVKTVETVLTSGGIDFEFTGLPAASTIYVMTFSLVSTNGTQNPTIHIGDSGGFETSAYTGMWNRFSTTGVTGAASVDGADWASTWNAANILSGMVTIALAEGSSNTWVISGQFGYSSSASQILFTYRKTLTGTLDRIRARMDGTDTWDGGTCRLEHS